MEKRFDDDCLASGDLGLGAGLKPGGIPLCSVVDPIIDCCPSESDSAASTETGHEFGLLTSSHITCLKVPLHTPDFCEKSDCSENFPVYAEVEYGTSLRQQKEIYSHNLGTILKIHGLKENSDSNGSIPNQGREDHPRLKRLTSEEIERNLIDSLQEIEELKLELETCERRLDAKYKGIAILKQQAEEFRIEQEENDKKTEEFNHELVTEMNQLQFELQLQESTTLDSQQLWAERFDRICKENADLMTLLESRSDELHRFMSQKMALAREKDELLALIDVQEKMKYEKSRSNASHDDFFAFTSTELAVLGACKCRGTSHKPCVCAHAAAVLRREIIKLREEIVMYKKRRDEAFLTVDAYRKAFEEQLQKSKFITEKLAELSVPGSSKIIKAKAAVKWLLTTLNDDEPLPVCKESEPGPVNNYLSTHRDGPLLCDREMVIILSGMLHEKKEVLAHQKLAAQILGDRIKDLEQQICSRD